MDFPFVPGDRHDAPVQPSRSQLELADDRHAALARFLDGRLIRRHARAQHDQVRARQRFSPVPAKLELHAQAAQRLGVGHFGTHLRQRDLRPPARQQLGGGNAAARRAHDRHAFSLDIKSRAPIPARARRARATSHHLSFSVVRLNKANTIATMTNRVITFGSLQPINSK